MESQAELLRETLAEGGVEAVIAAYLSPAHRDDAASGCTFAALLPELARQPLEARSVYAERLATIARELASALPPHIEDREAVAMSLYATLIGTLQLRPGGQRNGVIGSNIGGRRGCCADAGWTSLELAVPDRLLAQRVLNTAGNRVTDPDDDADENDGECELQCCDHKGLLISPLVAGH